MATPTEHVHQQAEVRTQSILEQMVEENRTSNAARYMPTLTVSEFSAREKMLKEIKEMLVEGVDYGKSFEGQEKPTLLKPGAEKICTFFGYAPHYTEQSIEDWAGERFGEPLFYYKYTCVLSKNKQEVGEGIGSCNSWESKYRYRIAGRKCPTCQVAALIETKKFKPTDVVQWLCFKKKGGCGAKFDLNDTRITEQTVGRVSNPDFADVINTVQKIGCKRAYVAATLSATGASQYFTQDLEDAVEMPDTGGHAVGTQAAADHVAAQKLGNGKPAVTEDPEVEKLLARCKDVHTSTEVFIELADKIRAHSGDKVADKTWMDATKKHGDPAVKRGAWLPVIKDMLAVANRQPALFGSPNTNEPFKASDDDIPADVFGEKVA